LWQADDKFVAACLSAFPGFYQTADAEFIDGDGHHQCRRHRRSTGEIEEVLTAHPDVAECAVIGVADTAQGASSARPLGAEGRCRTARWRASRQRLSSLVCRRPARARSYVARGEDYSLPATIDDSAVLTAIDRALSTPGYAKR
jgi:propionyl-CoA synthetase